MPGPAQFSLLWDRVTWLDPFLVGNVQGVSSKGTRSLGPNKKSDGGELQSPSPPSRGLPFLYLLLLKCLARVSWAQDSGSHKACVKTGCCNTVSMATLPPGTGTPDINCCVNALIMDLWKA